MIARDRYPSTVPRSPHLPDIRDLTDDTRPDWGVRFRTAIGVVFVCLSLAAIALPW